MVTHYYPEHKGGIEIGAIHLVNELLRNKHLQIEWIASDICPHPFNIQGLNCIPVKAFNFLEKYFGIPYPMLSIDSLFKIWDSVKKADIVHIHDYLYIANLLAILFSKIHHKPVVITQHISIVPYNNPFLMGIHLLLNHTLGSFVLSKASQVIFYSEVIKKYFSRIINFKRPPIVVPLGVDHKIYFSLTEEERLATLAELGFLERRPLILFVGRFVEKKGLNIIKELATYFKGLHWVIIGNGPLKPEKWDLPNLCVFRNLTNEKLVKFYQIADLFILPSKGEGLPLVILEAMACGTPVLVSTEVAEALPYFKGFVIHEKIGGKNDVETWSKKITELIENKNYLTALRIKVSEISKKHWGWDTCAKDYLKVFGKLCNSKD